MSETAHERDARLAEWVERLLADRAAGSEIDWDAIATEVPDIVDELRELWVTAVMADEVAKSHAGELGAVDGTSEAAVDLPGYQIQSEIGRGGMGIVYRARQLSLGRDVAVKQLLRGRFASHIDMARFRAEAESAARLNHPHIVAIHEVGSVGDVPYFSMQLIEGDTLAERLRKGPLPPREAAEILLPICRAVAHAHRQGILHRDLKPSNILLDAHGVPYVTDFGLAKSLHVEHLDGATQESPGRELTLSGAILGTPGYLSPEQAAGKREQLGTATDVYGLGAILYAMLTGQPPFTADTAWETLKLVQQEDPILPRVRNPQCDRELEMIALKCLQKPTDLRYPSADAMADDLERYLANEPIHARSSHLGQVISRAFRETHHAAVLQNWGLLWMWHSAVVLLLCVATNVLQWQSVEARWPYLGLWVGGAGLWAWVFWQLRRRAGPVTFVERVIAHVWAASMITDTLLFVTEWLLGIPVLYLSPVLALVGGFVFLVKAVLLSGIFYIAAAALFATAIPMAYMQRHTEPNLSVSLLGVVLSAAFFFPGLKYYRESRRAED